ncbi:hypothetical protein SDRG_01727 [Saprolegnia diclina VS20]|uniref:Uncharacterized protein n=1 Tax=Saprolegnia diclina (strain VS20) TaxID=1156394 RepID=T0R115_SAPDV|nr:hypothetical protein SDRG_01727 [Saprolegnia diclina VS20]EQC40646.1 hypothetical protein SDRG_01727 [Saprolegnia diclina VS20]|eukprot:XP_008605490.1 hypothetical protein SDRG_01727 [Saprolegnia diclina VS20]
MQAPDATRKPMAVPEMSHEYIPIDDNRPLSLHEPEVRGRVPAKLGQIGVLTLLMGIGLFFVGAVNLSESTQAPTIDAPLRLDIETPPPLDAMLTEPIFPLDSSFHHYTLSADDEGDGYVSADGRAFRSDHTNLFGRGVTGKIVSVDGNAFLIRSNGECCRFMDPGDEILLKPQSFANYLSVGAAEFDSGPATLWADPEETSLFWVDVHGLPLRWDYIPKSPLGKRITAGKMISMVYANFTTGTVAAPLFDVPASCTTAQRCRFD